jgi:hypothetical protein
MMRWLRLAPLFCLFCACDVASVREAPSAISRNECESNADCAGGLCTSDGQCRSRTASFETVLFEVTLPDDGSAVAGAQFQQVKDLRDGDASLDLGLISQVAGRVQAEELKCVPQFVGGMDGIVFTAADLSVPALVSLVPTTSALGLYSPRAVVQSGAVDDTYWGFSVNVPPGTYDIYVQPNRQRDERCPLPPQLLRGQALKKGTLSLDIKLPKPLVFEFHVAWPLGDGALNGWTLDVLDAVSGRVISNRVPLALGAGGTTDYVASVSYNPVLVVGTPKAPQQEQLFRLSPPEALPESEAAPTVLLARSAFGLFDGGNGTLTAFTALPRTVHVHGQVTVGDSTTPAAANVSLVAREITGLEPGVFGSFARTVKVGPDGQFDVHLLPGTYGVSTVPVSPLEPSRKMARPLAADVREWRVASTPAEQAGKVIGLPNALPVTGHVVDASGAPVASAQIQAVASPLSIQSDILNEMLGRSPFVPRASAGGVDGTGNFDFKTDPGTFDLSVRPNPDTGFAWLVMPNVKVSLEDSGLFLSRISMPLPVPYRGTVTVDGSEGVQRIPGALVRAYIHLKDGQYTPDAPNADSVLQVAETRADKNGAFEVLIPAQLNRRDE